MNKKCICRFGHGYRALDREQCFSAKCFNPAVVENEITLDVDNVDLFRIEQVEHTDPSESYIRVRSDISMLFHAEATAKKIGTEGFRFLSESRRIKSSPTQAMMDKMPDDLIPHLSHIITGLLSFGSIKLIVHLVNLIVHAISGTSRFRTSNRASETSAKSTNSTYNCRNNS